MTKLLKQTLSRTKCKTIHVVIQKFCYCAFIKTHSQCNFFVNQFDYCRPLRPDSFKTENRTRTRCHTVYCINIIISYHHIKIEFYNIIISYHNIIISYYQIMISYHNIIMLCCIILPQRNLSYFDWLMAIG